MSNEELIRICNEIDSYKGKDSIVTDYTRKNLKSLLISGANPVSSNFKDRFPDEYYLFKQITKK